MFLAKQAEEHRKTFGFYQTWIDRLSPSEPHWPVFITMDSLPEKDCMPLSMEATRQPCGGLRRRQSMPDATVERNEAIEELDTVAEMKTSPEMSFRNRINKNLLPVRRQLNRTASTSKVLYAMIRLAITEDNYRELQALLRRKDAKIDEIEGDGMASIHFAAMYGTCESIKILIKEGAKINIPSTSGEYPVDIACKNGNFEIAQFLIEKGARLDNVVDGTPCASERERKKNRMKNRSHTIDATTMGHNN